MERWRSYSAELSEVHEAQAKELAQLEDVKALKEKLASDSVVSLGHQGGAMVPTEATAFLSRRWANDAVTLRRADDRGKLDGLAVGGLDQWVPVLRRVSEMGAGAPGPPCDDRPIE